MVCFQSTPASPSVGRSLWNRTGSCGDRNCSRRATVPLGINTSIANILVADAPRRASSRPLLQQLHWLPVEARITYKLCTLMYRVFNGIYSAALAELRQVCSDDRLRSALRQDYVVPRTFGWQFIFCCGTCCVEPFTGRTSLHTHLQLVL